MEVIDSRIVRFSFITLDSVAHFLTVFSFNRHRHISKCSNDRMCKTSLKFPTFTLSSFSGKMEIQALSSLFNMEKHETDGKACTRHAEIAQAPITHFADCYFPIQLHFYVSFSSSHAQCVR